MLTTRASISLERALSCSALRNMTRYDESENSYMGDISDRLEREKKRIEPRLAEGRYSDVVLRIFSCVAWLSLRSRPMEMDFFCASCSDLMRTLFSRMSESELDRSVR